MHKEDGAIYDMVTFKEEATDLEEEAKMYVAAGINAMVKVYQIVVNTETNVSLYKISEVDSQIIVYKLKVH
jgi:hypothetical protein